MESPRNRAQSGAETGRAGRESVSNYTQFRGKCREAVEALCKSDKRLTPVRGHYICPIWGKQAHWWATNSNGDIIDPTAKQFPSGGIGEYIPFDGMVECAECKRQMREEDVKKYESRYAFCSEVCFGRFVGVSS